MDRRAETHPVTEQRDEVMDARETGDLRRLLLHRLAPAEAQRLEERLMLEEELGQRLRDAENDLLDDYARGTLSAEDRGDVERWLLTTLDGQRRATLARAMHGLRHEGNSTRAMGLPRRWRAIGLFAAACAVMVAILIARPPTHTPEALNVLLLADRARGSAAATVDIASDIAAIRLQLEVPDATDPARKYRVTVVDAQARTIYIGEDLVSREEGGYAFVEVYIPSSHLPPAAYRISLQPVDPGAAPSASFHWDIEVRPGA